MSINRRSFLKNLTAGALAGVTHSRLYEEFSKEKDNFLAFATHEDEDDSSPESSHLRNAKAARDKATALAFRKKLPKQKTNGEENEYPTIATFTKGLRHDDLGEVSKTVFKNYLKALKSENPAKMENLPVGDKKLKNPLAGLTYDFIGLDARYFKMKPAPRIDSNENSAEMAELYWMALSRDINFTDYENSEIINQAASDLSSFIDYKGPKNFGSVVPSVAFRGSTAEDLVGPYISQFLYMDVPIGNPTLGGQSAQYKLIQKLQTTTAGNDHLTEYLRWLHRNSGGLDNNVPSYNNVARHIINGRDLATLVHIDIPFQYAVNAIYGILNMKVPYDNGNPYVTSTTMDSFVSYGYPYILNLASEVAMRASWAVWYQKWYVHRRFRPETFGGRIHNHLSGKATYSMIDTGIFNSSVIPKVFDYNVSKNFAGIGTYLLPQAYPEGSPLHPAYGSGHSAMIGAAITVIKAFFDDSAKFTTYKQAVVPNSDGSALVPYTGSDASEMTIIGELNKLAYNIAIGRVWSGVHWRSDSTEGILLGEKVALQYLKFYGRMFKEKNTFEITTFSGRKVRIKSN